MNPAPPDGHGSLGLYPLRVLVVDDGADTSGVLRQLTDGTGSGRYVVERATTIADGFEAIVSGEHDVCVVDHHIGVRTGFDLLARVGAEDVHVPVVFIAGSGDHGSGMTAVGAGASCYVVEDGIGSEHLDQCLRQAMDQQETLSRLVGAGVAVDGGAPTKARIYSHIADRLGEQAAAILDATRTAQRTELPAYTVASLATIEDEVATLLTLMHDLNDLSMLDSGHLSFDAAPFSLRGLVSRLKRITGPASTSCTVEIVDDVSARVPDSVVGDPGRLRLVVAKFVDHVVARSLSDRVLLKIDVEQRALDTVTLRFDVAASGHGHDSDREPTTGDGSTEIGDSPSAFDDHGVLGVPVALETVSRMGGHVIIDEAEGQPVNIQFTIRLGIDDDEHQPRPAIDIRAPFDRPILVIADTLDDRRSIVKTLSDSGLPHVVASSAEEWATGREAGGDETVEPALALIASTRDSFAECDRFRESDATIPIIVIASSGQRGDAVRCRERAVRGYLAHPILPGDLVDAIRSTMALVESGDTSTLVTRHWMRDGRRSLHVLVVDDSPTFLFLMTRMLDQRGHSTETAFDGNEAVEAIKRDTFDVVLMDMMMPGIDGLEATRLIRSMDGDSIQHPFIVGVSSFADEADRDSYRHAGMDALVSRPIRPDDLFALIESRQAAAD
ncbi:MAG: response regulator [Actinomycetota bacterium]|nr:response regulator [Actinomycetota bacterium]